MPRMTEGRPGHDGEGHHADSTRHPQMLRRDQGHRPPPQEIPCHQHRPEGQGQITKVQHPHQRFKQG